MDQYAENENEECSIYTKNNPCCLVNGANNPGFTYVRTGRCKPNDQCVLWCSYTPPPPEPFIHSLATTSERGHIYQAVGAVIPGGGLSAIVNTKTTTYTAMKTLSVDYRLERWTGTAWVTFKINSNNATNTNLLNATSDWTVMPGYYYRVTSIHTAYDGSTTDTSKHVSGTVLF
ncbi:hypothetical protein MT997_23545 [Paenibacillus sp. OVF10]|nr:hypothetical protein MT997_23545 [Paenibacillus sp. OVF10]